MEIRIASRESRLALWQAEHVKAKLLALPGVSAVQIIGMTTTGDQIVDRSLAKVGGKGLFVKELEKALLAGEADLAVHSAKDVPMRQEFGLQLIGFMARENPHDAFISNDYACLAELPAGAIVGTSSLRRQAQILAAHPHLRIEPLRGNLDTRFRKLEEGQYAAMILAFAGVHRLGMGTRIREILSPAVCLPAAGQGALALEIGADRADLQAVLQSLVDPHSTWAIEAERTVARELGGSCQVPLAAYATLSPDEHLTLTARVASVDGRETLQAQAVGCACDGEAIALKVVERLREQGAERLIAQALGPV
ncbi:MAG: hydroxymethylbilane synthase [Burkholderiaceae bacterium]|jgi:hydroxymethylbilane synthase